MSDKRFTFDESTGMILDNTALELHPTWDNQHIVDLLNNESERADRNAEMNTDEELLKLRWQRDIYERFSKETMRILDKYGISDLQKLDQCLFNQRVW